MAERTVYIKVGAKVDGAVAGLRKVKGSVDDLTKADLKKPGAAFDGLSSKAALAGGVVALGIGKAISSFADFDAAMSGVAANSGAAGAELEALRAQAVKLGSETSFSATEAADGINELAKAGVSTAEILNGGLKGALDLAAAGQIGVAEAAETTASALNQFGLNGDKAGHVADLLANAANAAQGSVGDMGAALGQAGVAANAAGLDIDETTTLLALFAKAGMTGSDAGTSLKTMMQRLSAPTDSAAAAMESLGISAYDAQGEFVGAESLIGQLSEATSSLSTESKMAAFNTIFGADAIRAASIAAAAGADGYRTMAGEVTKAGGAAENAAKLTDNLKGDIERLGGSIETAFITGGSAANGALRTLTQSLGGVVDVVSKIPAPLLLAGAGFAAVALTLPKGISTFRDFKATLDTLGLSMDKATTKAPKLAAALRGLGAASAVLVIGSVASSLEEFTSAAIVANPETERLAEGLSELAAGAQESSDFGSLFARGMGFFRNDMEDTNTALDNFAANARAALDPTWFETATGGTSRAVGAFEERAKQLDAALAQLAGGGKLDEAKKAFQLLADAAARNGVPLDKLKESFPQFAGAVESAGAAAEAAAPQFGESSEAVKDVEQKAQDAKDALDELTKTISGFGSPLAAQRAAQRSYADAIRGTQESIKAYTEDLIKQRLEEEKIDPEKATDKQVAAAKKWAQAQLDAGKALDITTEAGSKNQASLDGIRDATLEAATATLELTGSSDQAAKVVAAGRAEFVKQATALGLSSVQANLLADNLGLIPKDVKTQVGLSGVADTNAKLDKITGKVTTLDKKTAKPKITPSLNGVQMDVAEARLYKLARPRTAVINVVSNRLPSGVRPGDFVGGGAGTRATGGPVSGPGTGTSDTAGLYALSNGEHILTAAEVAAAGGHGAILSLRKALLSGGLSFQAAGGPVGFPPTAYRTASTVGGGRYPSAADIGAAVARNMGPQIGAIYGGPDTVTAVRQGLRDYDWRVST